MTITDLDADALSRAIHARKLSCREVMQAYLARIDRLNPRFNAIVNLAPPEPLLEQADERDAELARGESRGWMHGMPSRTRPMRWDFPPPWAVACSSRRRLRSTVSMWHA